MTMYGLMLILVLCGSYYKVGEGRRVEGRIYEGTKANIKNYPYQVSFVINDESLCGGFIISKDYIVTAAHCIEDVKASQILLRAGSANRTNGTVIPIAEVHIQPDYDKPEFDKDVGVLKTVNPIKFTDKMQPLKLPEKGSMLKDGSEIVVTGWGITKEGRTQPPEQLMVSKIPVLSQKKCRTVYYDILTKNMFCGGDLNQPTNGTCPGDSGGPAVQNGVAVGITSFGIGCGVSRAPNVYALVSAPPIRDFIAKITGI